MADGSPTARREVSSPDDAIAKPRQWIAVDTETFAISDDDACPAVVCLTVYSPEFIGPAPVLYAAHPDPALCRVGPAWEWVLRVALETNTTIVGHHLPFDIVGLLTVRPDLTPLVFDLLDAGLFECTLLCDKLDDIARGEYDNKGKQRWHDLGDGRKPFGYSLKDSAKIRLGVDVDKGEDTYRARFGEFFGLPVEQWPPSAVAYALGDASLAHQLRAHQEATEQASPAREGAYVFADAPAQTRMGVCLMLMRAWGIRTDPVHTARLKASLEKRTAEVLDDLIKIGFVRAPKWRTKKKEWTKPSKDTKAIKAAIVEACAKGGVDPLRTEGGDVSMSAEAIDAIAQWSPTLPLVVEFSAVQKLTSYTEILASGHVHAIHSEPNTLVANGRISWGSESPDGAEGPQKVNLTNLPGAPGVRECYVPRAGNVFFAVDYGTLELCTVGQVCMWLLGHSRLVEMINDGTDMHCKLGELFVGRPYDELVAGKKARDPFCLAVREATKKANFGFWGGMGIDRFMSTCREVIKQLAEVGIVFDEAQAKLLKRAWLTMLPEAQQYFDICAAIEKGSGQILQYTSGRVRGGLGFCDLANTFFSGLAADGMKDAAYHVTREMYAEPDSPLFGARLIVTPHDELVGECPEERGHIVAHRVSDIMIARMRRRTPDVKIKTSIALCRRWRKSAEAYYVDGVLRPHEDSPAFAKALADGDATL